MYPEKNKAHLEWIKIAEEAVKRGDYETAARYYRYVTIHFGILNDMDNMKKFTIKTGECYLNAGKNLQEDEPIAALQFYIKASNCFREGQNKQKIKRCDSLIESLYDSIWKDEIIKSCKDAFELKKIGDYFINHDLSKTIKCYEAAAKKALESGKPNLSGSLYGVLGECYASLKKYEDAAKNYARSAGIYYECRECFEAAWRYCLSGFYFILSGNLNQASFMATRAESVCIEDKINVILNDLALICKFLSEGSINEAKKRWVNIRRKFKEKYVKLIESCFQTLNSAN